MKATRSIWTGSILVMTASIVLLGGCIGETQSKQESVYSNGRTDGPILSVKSPSEDIEESVPSTSVDIGWGEIRMRGFT
ncbi:MAG: hypothetical protein GY845_07775, partial [Planctomycetes bacterium]|nr:hypothetical protein [Planctomycetota bacterium]